MEGGDRGSGFRGVRVSMFVFALWIQELSEGYGKRWKGGQRRGVCQNVCASQVGSEAEGKKKVVIFLLKFPVGCIFMKT